MNTWEATLQQPTTTKHHTSVWLVFLMSVSRLAPWPPALLLACLAEAPVALVLHGMHRLAPA